MIQANIRIASPLNYLFTAFKNVWNCHFNLGAHKHWEFEIYVATCMLLEFELDVRFRGSDHAGPSLSLNVLGLAFATKIYDERHWDHDENDWAN